MAFKAINDIAGPDSLIPILLVYGAYPRMTENDPLSPSVSQRTIAIRKAMTELQKIRAKQQVTTALNHRNGPNTTSVQELPLNSDALVWREGNTGQAGTWQGPYKLVSTDGDSCVLALPNGNTTFRITSVKPYYTTTQITADNDTINSIENNDDTIIVQPTKRPRGQLRKHYRSPDLTVFLQDNLQEDSQYHASRQTEVQGLIEKGVFEPVLLSALPKGIWIFNSRFVDEIKNPGTEKAFAKSRLVV